MKKKLGLISGLFLGIASVCAIGLGTLKVTSHAALAEDETTTETDTTTETTTDEEVFECTVVIAETKHGTVTVDKEKGHVGEIVTITANHELFYLVENVNVNDNNLVESEETSGVYTFALVEGVNTINVKFSIDKALLGELSVIVDQAANKDWKNLFSVENVIRIVAFLLNGGILIAVVRYFIKDKRLESKVESSVKETVNKVIPETTKQIVLSTIEEFITPIFTMLQDNMDSIIQAIETFSKCLALSQENTPESRIAIIDELSKLNIGDANVTEQVKRFIEEALAKHRAEMEQMMSKISEISESNRAIAQDNAQEPAEEQPAEEEIGDNSDNGTQI